MRFPIISPADEIRNRKNPKDEGEIDHIAPGARDVTAYHGPKGARAINYLLPGSWDVGVAKSVSHIRPRIRGPRRPTCDSPSAPATTKTIVLKNGSARHASAQRCCRGCRHAPCERQEDERCKCQHGDQSPCVV